LPDHRIHPSLSFDHYTPCRPLSNLPASYKHVFLREALTAHITSSHENPRSRLTGHPFAPFFVPFSSPVRPLLIMPSPVDNSIYNASPDKGLNKTPLVLVEDHSMQSLVAADDLPSMMIDTYLNTCEYSSASLTLINFWLYTAYSDPRTRTLMSLYHRPIIR
jgi:hypothetical protein